MSEQPTSGGALRGAVDLSGLSGASGSAGAGAPAPTGAPAGRTGADGGMNGLVIEATDATFSQVVNRSVSVASIVVLWSPRVPESAHFLQTVVEVARQLEGRLQVVSVDVDANPGLLQAFQAQSVPVSIGLVQAQPVPLFAGVQPAQQVRAYADELLKLAVQHGVTGRVQVSDIVAEEEAPEPELPPLHREAFDAIERGDFAAATAAYRKALAENPGDQDAELGLAQVSLLERTQGVDLAQARAAAAERPDDIDAQVMVADLDLLGGHVEDAFLRLIDLVRRTAGEDRDRVRTHLVGLFAVVGSQDERVRKARTSLMSALF